MLREADASLPDVTTAQNHETQEPEVRGGGARDGPREERACLGRRFCRNLDVAILHRDLEHAVLQNKSLLYF